MRNIANLLNPKIDYVFKRIFGHRGNEEITKKFLMAITKEDIKKIELDKNPITEKDLLDDKIGILDIKATLNNNINCDIEVQVADRKNIEKRILFYWSKLYSNSIRKGKKYDELEKAIVILITDYNIKKLRNLNQYITKWKIKETKNPQLILTDDLEIYIIESNKAKHESGQDELNKWLKFINNPEESVDMENKEIKKAKEVLEEISADEHERYLAELRQKYIMDKHAIEDAGYDKGLEAGIKQKQKEVAKKLKDNNVDIKIISDSTGLKIEEIENL